MKLFLLSGTEQNGEREHGLDTRAVRSKNVLNAAMLAVADFEGTSTPKPATIAKRLLDGELPKDSDTHARFSIWDKSGEGAIKITVVETSRAELAIRFDGEVESLKARYLQA